MAQEGEIKSEESLYANRIPITISKTLTLIRVSKHPFSIDDVVAVAVVILLLFRLLSSDDD